MKKSLAPLEKVLTPLKKSQPLLESFNLPMHLKKFYHPETISPPSPGNLSIPLTKLNITEIIPNPPEKISPSKTFQPLQKQFKHIPEKSQRP